MITAPECCPATTALIVVIQFEDNSRLCLLVILGVVLGATTDTTTLSCTREDGSLTCAEAEGPFAIQLNTKDVRCEFFYILDNGREGLFFSIFENIITTKTTCRFDN